MRKEKVILFIKKDFIFPDFWVFRRINQLYWWVIINLFVMNTIKKYRNYDLFIVSDLINKIILEKKGVVCNTFGDYIEEFKSMYPKALGMLEKWFNSLYLKDVLKYKSFNLGFIEQEELSYWFYPLLDYFNAVNKIFATEKPKMVIIAGKKDIINRYIYCKAKERKVYCKEFIGSFDNITCRIERFFKKHSLTVRFYNLPRINRKEFVKTKKCIEYKKEKRNILLLGLDDTYFSRLGSVPYELMKDKENGLSILCSNLDTQRFLKEKGFLYFSFGDFLNSKIMREVKAERRRLAHSWKVLSKNKNFREIFHYEGTYIFDVISDELFYLFSTRFPWLMYYIETTKELIETIDADAIITIDDALAVTRAIVILANSKNITTLVIQNGILATIDCRGFLPVIADKMAVWGEMTKREMIKEGGDPNRIVVTGNPQSTRIKKEALEDKFYRKLRLDKNKETFLFATQAFGDLFAEKEIKKLLGIILNIFKVFPDKQLIINLHIRDEPELYNKIVNRYGLKNVMITKGVDLNKLLNLCDVLITINSSIAAEIMLLGKPVLITNFLGRGCAVPYTESGAAIGIKNENELYRVVNIITKNYKINKNVIKKRKKFLYETFYKQDGEEGRRIVNLIKKLIKVKKNRGQNKG